MILPDPGWHSWHWEHVVENWTPASCWPSRAFTTKFLAKCSVSLPSFGVFQGSFSRPAAVFMVDIEIYLVWFNIYCAVLCSDLKYKHIVLRPYLGQFIIIYKTIYCLWKFNEKILAVKFSVASQQWILNTLSLLLIFLDSNVFAPHFLRGFNQTQTRPFLVT